VVCGSREGEPTSDNRRHPKVSQSCVAAFEQRETDPLLIRPVTVSDLDGVHVLFSDAEVMCYVPGGACDRAATRARLQSLMDHRCAHGFRRWAIIEEESGQLIGDYGLE
jgi:[ribosomal protein S5]-alanine N-acetyltransferase